MSADERQLAMAEEPLADKLEADDDLMFLSAYNCGIENDLLQVGAHALRGACGAYNGGRAVKPHWRNVIDTLEWLPVLVRDERRRRGLSHRDAGAEIGYSYADLCRFEKGTKVPTLTSAVAMLRWLSDSSKKPGVAPVGPTTEDA